MQLHLKNPSGTPFWLILCVFSYLLNLCTFGVCFRPIFDFIELTYYIHPKSLWNVLLVQNSSCPMCNLHKPHTTLISLIHSLIRLPNYSLFFAYSISMGTFMFYSWNEFMIELDIITVTFYWTMSDVSVCKYITVIHLYAMHLFDCNFQISSINMKFIDSYIIFVTLVMFCL